MRSLHHYHCYQYHPPYNKIFHLSTKLEFHITNRLLIFYVCTAELTFKLEIITVDISEQQNDQNRSKLFDTKTPLADGFDNLSNSG